MGYIWQPVHPDGNELAGMATDLRLCDHLLLPHGSHHKSRLFQICANSYQAISPSLKI
jgi:hypothetical protein